MTNKMLIQTLEKMWKQANEPGESADYRRGMYDLISEIAYQAPSQSVRLSINRILTT